MNHKNPSIEFALVLALIAAGVLSYLYTQFGFGGDECPKCKKQKLIEGKECLEYDPWSDDTMCLRGKRYKLCKHCGYEETIEYYSDYD